MGDRIRTLRGAASQTAFASRLGISREQLSRIESGAQVPGTGTLRRLARVTGVSLDVIVLGAVSAGQDAAGAGTAWLAALEPLLAATTLKVTPASARRADRAWEHLSEARREEVRALVRRIALVAAVVEALLPAAAARAVLDSLAAALPPFLTDDMLSDS